MHRQSTLCSSFFFLNPLVMLRFSSFSVIHLSFDIAILKGQSSEKNSWRRTLVEIDVKNVRTALRPSRTMKAVLAKSQAVMDCGVDGPRQHRTLRGTWSL